MATEDIRIEDGHVKVDRVEYKSNVDVALSDVESVSYTRGARGGTGALVLNLKNGGNELIRVEAEDAGRVLELLTDVNKPPAEDLAPAESTDQEAVDRRQGSDQESTENSEKDAPTRSRKSGKASNS